MVKVVPVIPLNLLSLALFSEVVTLPIPRGQSEFVTKENKIYGHDLGNLGLNLGTGLSLRNQTSDSHTEGSLMS